MIKYIRNFLCTVDPMGATVLIAFAFLIGVELFVLGIVKFLGIIAIGLVLAALVFAIGWLLYKSIVLLQRCCK